MKAGVECEEVAAELGIKAGDVVLVEATRDLIYR